MSDLISRQDVIDAVHYYIESGYKCDIFQELKDLPTAESERKVKVTDTWKISGFEELNAWCPECEHRITRGCSYCPTCGVKLEWNHE